MNSVSVFMCIMVICVALSSFSQILLKKSALKTYADKISSYLNPLVLTGYGIFFFCSVMSVFCYKYVPLSSGTVIDSLGYIFVPIFSYIFLKEKLSVRQVAGVLIIMLGFIIFTIWG